MALRVSDQLLMKHNKVVKIAGSYQPFFRRIQETAKKKRYPQSHMPFLETSRAPSIRPPIPDPRAKRLIKVDLAHAMGIYKGDRVRVLYGSEKGLEGIIDRIIVHKNQVIVKGINMKRSFWHPDPGAGKPSIVSVECPIHITNVVLLDPVTKRPTRVKRRYMMNGECVRISKVSGCAMPEPVEVGPNEREELWHMHEEKSLAQAKERRGPMKEDVFGNKDHFQTLVRIMRSQRESASKSDGNRPPDE